MNKNIKVAKELMKLAKNLIALDEEGDGSGFQGLHDYENFQNEMLDLAQKQGKKYILHHKEGRFWRIQACKDFGDVKKGEFGGFVESEKNLSQEGDCWVKGNARIYGDATVSGNAEVWRHAKVYGRAKVYGDAWVYGGAQVYGDAQVFGKADVFGYAEVLSSARVSGDATVSGRAKVYGDAQVSGDAKISGKAKVNYDVKDVEITE